MLPEDVTCGAVCKQFPKCLPEPSEDLLRQLARLRDNAFAEHNSHAATIEALEAIRAALEGDDGNND
jgi:hypothetical protein